jgi:hypothetical protein
MEKLIQFLTDPTISAFMSLALITLISSLVSHLLKTYGSRRTNSPVEPAAAKKFWGKRHRSKKSCYDGGVTATNRHRHEQKRRISP